MPSIVTLFPFTSLSFAILLHSFPILHTSLSLRFISFHLFFCFSSPSLQYRACLLSKSRPYTISLFCSFSLGETFFGVQKLGLRVRLSWSWVFCFLLFCFCWHSACISFLLFCRSCQRANKSSRACVCVFLWRGGYNYCFGKVEKIRYPWIAFGKGVWWLEGSAEAQDIDGPCGVEFGLEYVNYLFG
ncbi:hypothetical protein DFH27DRAFT_52308 [Peziza echinospora]|nr:hypothetical protein DFH27DRAFT_52308 [Peziza echinospora]